MQHLCSCRAVLELSLTSGLSRDVLVSVLVPCSLISGNHLIINGYRLLLKVFMYYLLIGYRLLTGVMCVGIVAIVGCTIDRNSDIFNLSVRC